MVLSWLRSQTEKDAEEAKKETNAATDRMREARRRVEDEITRAMSSVLSERKHAESE